MSDRLRDALGVTAAVALGLAAFFVLVGWTTLIPTNIAWVDFADRAMHTLGWMFYRDTPWQMPPGLSPRLGIEQPSSIALVDGLPLFAIPFKLIGPWLPTPFQYWGDWLLLSFTLQAVFAYAIARELGAGRVISLIAAGFAIITPAFMFRVEMHLALSGHFTVLAALYLYVRRDPPKLWMWPLLVCATSAIHAYLLAMVIGLWAAALAERLWTARMTLKGAIVEVVVGLALAVAVLWTVGFFITGSLGSYGYGNYKLNLLGPLLTYKDWSQIFPDLPHTEFDYEGMSFLGIGILGLFVVAIVTGAVLQLRAAVELRWLPLTIMLILLTLFALSTTIHFGSTQLFRFTMRGWFADLVATLRSTGRFVWPLLYFTTIGVIAMVGRRLSFWIAVPLAVVAFGAQAIDSWPGLSSFAHHVPPPSSTWETTLVSPFWDRAAAAGYTRVRGVPVTISPSHDWKLLGYYAVTHGMDIDDVYLGRNDERVLKTMNETDQTALTTGNLEPHTLYILDVSNALLAAAATGPDDLLAEIDNRIVLAKGGAHLVDGLGIDPHGAVGN